MKTYIKIELFELLKLIQNLLLVNISKPTEFEHIPTELMVDGPLGVMRVRYKVIE